MLSTSMYNLADTYFVGTINTQSVAAVGISFSVMAIIQAVGFFFGHGSGNYISRQLGAKEHRKAEKMASTGFILSFFAGLLIAILGQISSLRSPSSWVPHPPSCPIQSAT